MSIPATVTTISYVRSREMEMETFVEIGAKRSKRCPLIGMAARALHKHYELFKPISQQQRPIAHRRQKSINGTKMDAFYKQWDHSDTAKIARPMLIDCWKPSNLLSISSYFPPRTGRGFPPVRNCRKSPPMNALEAWFWLFEQHLAHLFSRQQFQIKTIALDPDCATVQEPGTRFFKEKALRL